MAGCQRTSPLKLAPIVTHQRVWSYCFSWLGGKNATLDPQLIFPESSRFCFAGSLWSQGFDHICDVRVRVPEVFVGTTLHRVILLMRRLVYIYIYVYIVSLLSTFFFETVKQKSKTWYHVVSQTVSIWPLNFSARQTAGLQWGWWPTGRHSRPGLVGEVKLGIQIFHQRNVDVAWGGMLLCSWRGPGNRVDLVKIFCVPDRRAVRLRYVDGRWW